MSASIHQPDILKLVANWSDLYQRNFYNLAMFEVDTALKYQPNHPLLWFFKAITQLAQRDGRGARASFDRSKELSRNAVEERELQGIAGKLQQGLLIAERAFARDVLPAPPKSALEWLEGDIPKEFSKPVTAPAAAAPAATAKAPAPEARAAVAAVASVLSTAVASAASSGDRYLFSPNPAPAETTASSPSIPRPSTSPTITSTGGQLQVSAEQPAKVSWDQWERELRKHIDAGAYDKALNQVNLAIQRHSADHWLAEWRARILEKQGNRAEAVKQLTEAARLAVENNLPDKASAIARDIVVMSHTDGDGLLRAGAALAGIGLTTAAADALRHAETLARRANDHPRLVAALRQLERLYPQNSAYGHEVALLMQKISSAAAQVAPAQNQPGRTLSRQEKKQKRKEYEQRQGVAKTVPPAAQAKTPIQGGGTVGAAPQAAVSAIAMLIAFIAGSLGNTIIPIMALVFHNAVSAGIAKTTNNANSGIRRFAVFVIIVSIIMGIVK